MSAPRRTRPTATLLALGTALALGAARAETALASPASAQTKSSSNTWGFTFAPYIMGAAMDGTVVVQGQEAEVDVSASDIFHHLDWGFMSMFAARKGDWAIGGDLLYVELNVETQQAPGTFEPALGIVTVQGARRLADGLDLTFGARWNH